MESYTKDHDLCRHRQYMVSTKIMDVYVYNNALTDLKEMYFLSFEHGELDGK